MLTLHGYINSQVYPLGVLSQKTYTLAYFLTPWTRVLPEKPGGPQVWNPKVHYCIHKGLPLVTVLSRIDLFPATLSHFLKIHFNIILPYIPGSSPPPLRLIPLRPTYPPQKELHTLNRNSDIHVLTSVVQKLCMPCDTYMCLLCMQRDLGITCTPALSIM
jgi:hypothetical protein